MNEQIKDAITNGANKNTLRELVYTGDVVTLLQDGLNKVVLGETTFEEILKIVDLENDMTQYNDDNLKTNLKMAQQAHKVDNKTNDKPITSNITSEFKIEKTNNENIETVEF